MSDRFNSDQEALAQEALARLVRKAGDPSVSPDPQYAETLRAAILDRVGPAETVAPVTEGIQKVDVIPLTERARKMKRIAKLAAAASILVAFGSVFLWLMIGGGSTNIAFADVAKALDDLRTCTHDATAEMKDADGMRTTTKMKCFFLAPSRERVEVSVSAAAAKEPGSYIMILDHQARKGITLLPALKLATTIDLSQLKKPPGPSNAFELARQLVREGSSGSAEKVESLGEKEIDGRVVIGFRTRGNMANQTIWADPRTARPVRIELEYSGGAGTGVMSNFRYDMKLDPSLFSLQPPAGYSVNSLDAKMPLESDLVDILRLIAEHNDGTFPAAIGMANKEFTHAIQAVAKSETEEFLKEPAMNELLEKLKAQYGEDQAGFMKAWMKELIPFNQKLTQKHMQGMTFYNMLTSANDSHYVGKDVKLGTPNRPIFWYKPTGADAYRVIYADLRVKEMTADEVKKLPEANAK